MCFVCQPLIARPTKIYKGRSVIFRAWWGAFGRAALNDEDTRQIRAVAAIFFAFPLQNLVFLRRKPGRRIEF
jgi:hypothetical protein